MMRVLGNELIQGNECGVSAASLGSLMRSLIGDHAIERAEEETAEASPFR